MVIVDTPCFETSSVLRAIIARRDAILADVVANDGRHLVIADGPRKLRLWIRESAEVDCEAFVALPAESDRLRLGATVNFNRWLHGSGPQLLRPLLVPTPYKRRRLIQLIRIADADADGATLREIAYAVVFPHHPPLAASEWKSSSERRTCHRLLSAANRLIAGDYITLLAL